MFGADAGGSRLLGQGGGEVVVECALFDNVQVVTYAALAEDLVVQVSSVS